MMDYLFFLGGLVVVIVVGCGTSLPELTVTVVALARGQTDLALGNVLGSTLFNLLGVLGVTALVRPLAVPKSVADVHIWVMAGVCVDRRLHAQRLAVIEDRRRRLTWLLSGVSGLRVLLRGDRNVSTGVRTAY
jgi:Ca2+/Na+ antiporter